MSVKRAVSVAQNLRSSVRVCAKTHGFAVFMCSYTNWATFVQTIEKTTVIFTFCTGIN